MGLVVGRDHTKNYWQCDADAAVHGKCDERIKDNAFAKIRSEWFFTKDGKGYCPGHIPEWVEAWRQRKANGK